MLWVKLLFIDLSFTNRRIFARSLSYRREPLKGGTRLKVVPIFATIFRTSHSCNSGMRGITRVHLTLRDSQMCWWILHARGKISWWSSWAKVPSMDWSWSVFEWSFSQYVSAVMKANCVSSIMMGSFHVRETKAGEQGLRKWETATLVVDVDVSVRVLDLS